MMESSIIVGIGSIAIGLTAGILTLLKTAGAKREKIKSSYKEIISILIRSITQSQINLTPEELDRIVRSKSRNNGINRSDLFSDREIASDLYTNIIENEFIAPSDKKQILEDIDKLIKEISKEKSEVALDGVTRTIDSPQAIVSITIAMIATIISLIVAITSLPATELKIENLELFISLLTVIVIMAITLVAFENFSRLKKRSLEKENRKGKD